MKVYELMNELAKMPSGAEVLCSGNFTVKELKNEENCGNNDNGERLYSFSKDVQDVDNVGEGVYINF